MNPTISYMPLGEFVKRALVLGGLVIAVLGLWQLRLVLLLTFLAVVIAVSLDIPVRTLQQRGINRGVAIALVASSMFFGLGGLGFIIGTPLVEQTENLFNELPGAIEELTGDWNTFANDTGLVPQIELDALNETGDTSSIITADTLTGGALLVTSVGSFVLSVAVNMALVIIVSMYLLADPETYANSFLSLIPQNRQAFILKLLINLRHALVGWLVTQLFSMIVIGFLVWFSLGIVLGIPNAIALGMVSAILTIIPNFGPIVAAVPGIIFTLSERPSYFIPVLITYIVVQQAEANFITPMFMKRRLNIPAAALLVFQVICGVLFGFMGLLLAVPLFMVVVVLIRDLYVDNVLDNINTSIEASSSDDGTVLRVTSTHHRTEEVPLRQIFAEDEPLDLSLSEVMRALRGREKTVTDEQIMVPIHPDADDDNAESEDVSDTNATPAAEDSSDKMTLEETRQSSTADNDKSAPYQPKSDA
jgi:predicted PurR-regulated permease PerM